MNSPFFQVAGLTVQTKGFKLRDVSFSLDRDEYLIILGPTGCGKTMLLETLAGLRKPDEGQIFLEGNDITSWPPEVRSLGFAYQDSLLYPFLTVRENILFGARARKKHKEEKILKRLKRLTEAMGIAHLLQRFPKCLSGGEKQRVSLARAILTSPPVLLLDEPLSALDPQTRRSMQELLHELHQSEGLGIIHVTHDFNEALQLGTRVLVMNQGEIIQQGKPLDVFYKPKSLFVANFLIGENIVKGRLEKDSDVSWFKAEENDLIIGPLPESLLVPCLTIDAYLMLRASELVVAPADFVSLDKPNTWIALVEQVTVNSTHVELVCHGSGRWQAMLSMSEWRRLGIRVGSPVNLSAEMKNIHLIASL